MHRSTFVAIAALAAVFASRSAEAQCGGLCLYENMSPDMGRSAAGAGARAQDSSTAFWNPAGMTELGEGTEVMLGLGALFSELNPKLTSGTISTDSPVVSGGNAGGFAPLFGSYISTQLPYDVHFGMAVTTLYGGAADYNQNWAGRVEVTDVSLFSLLIQPSFAYAVTDWLSLGAGPTILYSILDQRLKASNAALAPTIKVNNAEDWSAGGAFSALVKPLDGTRIGLYYRTEIVSKLKAGIEGPLGLGPAFDGKFHFPQGANASLFQQLSEQWAILADAGWTDWSQFGQIPLTVGPLTPDAQLHWRDTWRTGIGFQYLPTEKWTLQGGFGYDSSPVKASRRQPVLPVSEQYRFSAGVMWRPETYMEIALSYTFEWFGDVRMNNVPIPGGTVLDGKFDPAYANIVGVNLKVKF
ncbi:MAG TPA: outer membrane protein transport protein [Myxococcota bacterium]|jgi:long-chain fatty acid transport protein